MTAGVPRDRARPIRCAGAAALGAVLVCAAAGAATAQELVVDRWLVTGAEPAPGANPLSVAGAIAYPDRDLSVGPGRWTLVREDGRSRFDFSGLTGPGRATLAHAYIKAPADSDAWLTLTAETCAGLTAWLNGQPLEEPRIARDVRLAGGWNTLLAVIEGDADCPRALGATLSAARGPAPRDRPGVGPSVLRVQASRPPGARPNFPDGVVAVSTPRVSGLTWSAGQNDLLARLAFDLTSWGRSTALATVGDGPTGPPAVDVSGDWELTLFSPTGIQRLTALLEMDEEGGLSGRLRRDRRDVDEEGRRQRGGAFEGNIREGWVSGNRFAWTLRSELLGRSVDLEFRGSVENGELRGTIDLGRLGDAVVSQMGSRFEGRRPGAEETAEPVEPEPAAGEPAPGAEPEPPVGVPASDAPGQEAEAGEPEPSSPTDPDGQRARMISRLLGPTPVKALAPRDGSVELRLAGESLVASAGDLRPASPSELGGTVPFRRLRDAALREDGLRAELRWNGGRRELSGRASADAVLRALHGPIVVEGLVEEGDGIARAELRVPDALAGFTLRGLGGAWWVEGQPAADGLLCSPCERGRRLRVGFQGTGDATSPGVQITDRGYPDAADSAGSSGASALEWLRALEGDNRRYRERAGG